MIFYNKIKLITDRMLKFKNKLINKVIHNRDNTCRIEKIDISKRIIVIHCRGVNAPIRLSFDELINDNILLSNLSPKHASWVGYYYGKYYIDLIRSKHNRTTEFDYSIENSTGKFKVIMLNRKGDLIYTDNHYDKNHVISPINAMANDIIIANFDPIQACYIGILAGTKQKNNHKIIINSKNTYLRLIK